MEQVQLGKSGLRVSRLILGCMSYGDPNSVAHPWALNLDESRPFIRQALEAGITTFDTANVYSNGAGEVVVGKLLRELSSRQETIIASKVYGTMGPGPKGSGLSRAAIIEQAEQSLRRLDTDYIDLYQIHRYDQNVPIEETLQALHDLVRSGKVRYIGGSSMWTWQFAQAQYTAELHGWSKFVSMQDHYNLLMREEEREMHPFCLNQGIGVIPWSPLARGRLARPWGSATTRSRSDRLGSSLYQQAADSDHAIVDALGAIADEKGANRAQIALAWMLHKPVVTAPIIGATKLNHLEDAVAALEVRMTDADMRALEEPSVPKAAEWS